MWRLSVSDPDREIVVAFVPGDIEDKILPASLSFVQQSSRFSGGCKGLGEFLRRSDLARLLMRPVERHSVHRPLLAPKRGLRSSLRRAEGVDFTSARESDDLSLHGHRLGIKTMCHRASPSIAAGPPAANVGC
jgi:hypothetical protein